MHAKEGTIELKEKYLDWILSPDNSPPEDVAAPVAAVVPQAAKGQLGDGRGVLRDRARGEAVPQN